MTELPEQQARDRALRTAANVLQYRQRSARALYDRLLEKGLEPELAEYAVERLQQLGYLNDAEYGRLLRSWRNIRPIRSACGAISREN